MQPKKYIIPFTLSAILFYALALSTTAKDIIAYPGDDLHRILEKAHKKDRILLHGGKYPLEKTLVIGIGKSGITWSSCPGENAVISGGIPIKGWIPFKNGIWAAPFKSDNKVRQLSVNGKPARMAKNAVTIKGQGYGTFRIKGDEEWALRPGQGRDGIRFPGKGLKNIKAPEDLEIRSRSTWVTNRVCTRGMLTDDSSCILLMEQPMASILQNHLWGTAFKPDSQLELYNALEFLDEPGEFYHDRRDNTLYYMPLPGEDMDKAEAYVPLLETLVSIEGKNRKTHVENVRFEGITFECAAWHLMKIGNSYGEGGVQSCCFTTKFGSPDWHDSMYQVSDLPAAAIEIRSAEGISFSGNIFRGLSSIGINIENDAEDITIEGNLFSYIGACAVNIGHPHHVYIGRQNGRNEGNGPYHIDNSGDKWDEKEEGLCSRIKISNNLIRHTGTENPSNVAISAIFGHHIEIAHNDIRYAPYTGISLGWAWQVFDGQDQRFPDKPTLSLRYNTVHHNRIGNVLQEMRDGGGIYLLAAQVPIAEKNKKQEWTEIYGNYLYDFGGPGRAGIHPDNGSRFVHFHDNVFKHIPWSLIKVSNYARKSDYHIENNYSDTPLYWSELSLPYAPDTRIHNNTRVEDGHWPEAAESIMKSSGLETEFKYLYDFLQE